VGVLSVARSESADAFNARGPEAEVVALYQQLLDGWNQRRARAMAELFADDGNLVGFDGSPLDGRVEIEAHLAQVFADHTPATYVAKVREVRLLSPGVALLRAVAGMVPPGQTDLHADVNAIQCLVAVEQSGQWRIALYQNTPAAFHGRPEASQALTAELRELL
jgi:uncharacterized protein (TIGR02246 family)